MSGPLVIRPGLQIPAGELQWRFSRSSGPGGQSVNTSDSRVSLSFDLARSPSVRDNLRHRALGRLAPRLVDGVLTVHAEAERSQHLNRLAAERRLAEILRAATDPPPRPRRPTRPTKASRERRLRSKQLRGQVKRLRRTGGEE